ncbi:hypothetical protein [Janthinobacterium sp. NKUCC06_STL]|uniref:hypothetical protein n=1 Tax=unclassified Janthinobacterium TaxID=2610881 RepID=UPI001C5AE5C8|nr:hypothetical protein [Janthinobacterium sp. NKUCC06_STL]MBW3512276.1 hypothetical protein [Janthinobacterium sp. NKUCC06_STL]
MATINKQATLKAFEIANNLSEISTLLLAWRIKGRRTLSPQQKEELKELEDHLNELVASFQAHGIDMIADGAQEAARQADQAIDIANAALEKIKDVKHAIDVAAAVVSVAATLLSKDVLGVVDATKDLQALLKAREESKNDGIKAPAPGAPSHAQPS